MPRIRVNMPSLPATGPAAGKDVRAVIALAIVRQRRLTGERRDATLAWMVEVQKMPEPDEEAMQRIRDYLKRHFSSEG